MSECTTTVQCQKYYDLFKQTNNRKGMVLFYIFSNFDKETKIFFGTYNQIATGTGISHPTVAKIMQSLQENGVVERINQGAWKVLVDKED